MNILDYDKIQLKVLRVEPKAEKERECADSVDCRESVVLGWRSGRGKDVGQLKKNLQCDISCEVRVEAGPSALDNRDRSESTEKGFDGITAHCMHLLPLPKLL